MGFKAILSTKFQIYESGDPKAQLDAFPWTQPFAWLGLFYALINIGIETTNIGSRRGGLMSENLQSIARVRLTQEGREEKSPSAIDDRGFGVPR